MAGNNNPLLSDRIYYEINSNCNLRCKHCSDLLSRQRGLYLPSEKIYAFHNKMCKKYGIRDSVVTGGEPGLHPEFYEIITKLATYGNVTVTSNGTLLDINKLTEILEKNQNITLQLSADAVTKEKFDIIRGDGTYNKLYKLIDQIADSNIRHQVGISMTIMQDNIDEVKAMIDFCEKKELAYVYFPTLLPVGVALKQWDTIAPEVNSQKQVEDQIFDKIANYDGKLKILSNQLDQICAKLIPEHRSDCLKSYTIKVCPDQYVMPCPVSYKLEHRLGSINDADIENKIADKLESMRKSSDQLRFQEKEKCSNCKIESYCSGQFCANCSLVMNNINETKDYFCQIYKYHIGNALKEEE